jgi:DNA-binding beta-propeller fold protein YncE/ABC-type Fe3+ transport system permease subunit
MRLSAWTVPLAGALPWVLAVVVPAVFGAAAVFDQVGERVTVRPLGSLFATSIAWALGVAAASMLIGWAPGRVLARLHGRRIFAPAMALMLAPVCVPAYIIFWCWWQFWPPDSALYRFAIEHDLVRLMRSGTLALGLVSWSWPIVAWCVAGMSGDTPVQREELLALDGANLRERWAERWRSDRRALGIGGLIVALATMMNTTCFDLAEVFTFSNELRALQALGAPPGQVLLVSLPMVAIAGLSAVLVWPVLQPSAAEVSARPQRVHALPAIVAGLLWCFSLLVPMALFIRQLEWPAPAREFVSLYGRSVVHTASLAVLTGAIAAIIAAGFALLTLTRARLADTFAAVLAVGWIVMAAIPGTTLASMMTAAYNQPTVLPGNVAIADLMYATPAALLLALLGRFAFIAALIGRAAGLSEPRKLADLRALDDATGLTAIVRTSWPRLATAMGAAFLIVAALSMSEITVTAQLYPPGLDPIAPVILNAMHYQQPETVMLAAIGLVLVALLATVAVGLIWLRLTPRRVPRRAVTIVACVFASLPFFTGCEFDTTRIDRPVDVERTFGRPGTSLGQFSYPRAVAADCARGFVYVIDKTARVQRFSLDGEPQLFWRMPKWDNGKPTGVSVAPDGSVFVADTHEFRITVFDSEGNELTRFGSYGMGEGEFIYTTDVAFGDDGRMYVSEYGGNDRVQVFDEDWNFLFQFGEPGDQPGQFVRPQSMCFSADGSELFVADSCNHRIQVFTPEGEFKRAIGTPGRGAGELAYPYGVDVLNDGSLLITEFGNNRIQRLSPEGDPMGIWGTVGRDPGQLQYPWSAAVCGEELFVLDSGNNRVQVMDLH